MEQKKVALTVNEAAEYTGIGRNTLRQIIAWEMIPILKIGKKILIRTEMLDAFLSVNEGNNLKNKREIIPI